MMECYICSAPPTGDSGLCCPACARDELYPVRLDHAGVLLQKLNLDNQVQAVLKSSAGDQSYIEPRPGINSTTHESSRRWRHEGALGTLAQARERLHELVRRSEDLRDLLEGYKTLLNKKRSAINARRADCASATTVASSQRSAPGVAGKRVIKKIVLRHKALSDQMVSDRAYLCTEAALLAGLRRWQHQETDGMISEHYAIGGVPLMDLRQLNNHSPAVISAALANVSQLLFLICCYFGIQLPAEIVIPDAHRPTAAIYQYPLSYKNYAMQDRSATTAVDVSSPDSQKGSSPLRLLVLDQKLPMLAREDSAQYLRFVQGVVLLAWNVTWLCRSQGYDIASDDWEDICSVGKNLWLLLLSASDPTTVVSRSSESDSKHTQRSISKTSAQAATHSDTVTGAQSSSRPSLGMAARTNSRAFLSGASAASGNPDLLRSWKFASPVPIIDKLKTFLLTEMSGLEWEVLDNKEFKVDTSSEAAYPPVNGAGSDGKVKGTSGWTKLKSRPST